MRISSSRMFFILSLEAYEREPASHAQAWAVWVTGFARELEPTDIDHISYPIVYQVHILEDFR